jgi:acyl-CoA synthetase (AMP-forming)/AMP-acid ligase II
VRGYQEGGPLPAVRPGDAAQIQYTSGTTGFPKGALLHHRGLVTNARFMITRVMLPTRGTMVSAMPLFHTAGCAMGVLGCAHQRACYVLCQLFDPGLGSGKIQKFRLREQISRAELTELSAGRP